ncbi:MAG: nitroreductase family protein [Firmicutes bacterium]|nr:nitroreductase family protein [Bacillota bacterium]
MTVMEAIQARYSVRKYTDRPIELEKIEKIMKAGRLAPTSSNQQLCKHIIVTDKELIHQMVSACEEQKWIETASAILVECASGDRMMICGQSARSMDCAIAMSYMTLEAVELGLQSCWLSWFSPDKVKVLLNIADDYVVVAVAPIGYPEKDGHRSDKKLTKEVVVYNKMK